MGSVFGKQTVAEPSFQVLLDRTISTTNPATVAYEIRKYGERFAAEVSYTDDEGGNQKSPFTALARYIGVFGTAENDGVRSMAMTAPVVIQDNNGNADVKVVGTKMAMTAPVVISDGKRKGTDDENRRKIMKFMLPAEYDERSKIPEPTNSQVNIVRIPPSVGAVHQFNGRIDESNNRHLAKRLAGMLMKDGVAGITEEYAVDNFEYWGYNPPFTLPWFRRNEVWVELSQEQVDGLMDKFHPTTNN